MQSNLTLSEPFPNCVYQRDNQGNALVPVSGTVTPGTANVLATFVPVNGGEQRVQTLPVDNAGNYGGLVRVPGGWYSLIVSAGGTTLPAQKVGAGEVFVVFGHSYMQGGHDATHQLPSTDERVITLLDTLDNRQNRFGQLLTSVGPFHDKPDAWGLFGDLVVRRLGVPVLIYGCAYGGSNILQNYELLTGATRTGLPPGAHEPTRQPFEPLERVMQDYVPKTGVRALLVEHGYNDRASTTAAFEQQFRYVFDYVRNTYQKPALPLVLVQEQLQAVGTSLYAQSTAPGLQHLMQTYPATYKGPDFNTAFWLDYFTTSGHDHLFGTAIDQFAKDWNTALTPGFLSGSTPYLTASNPDVFPAVLYNAPTTELKPVDWLILLGAAVCLVSLFFWKNKYLIWAFLLLAVLAGSRLTGKI